MHYFNYLRSFVYPNCKSNEFVENQYIYVVSSQYLQLQRAATLILAGKFNLQSGNLKKHQNIAACYLLKFLIAEPLND